MAYRNLKNLVIENAKIMFANFSGVEKQYNNEGERNFCVVIEDPIVAQQMKEDGWNVRLYMPRDPEERPFNYVQVKVSYQPARFAPHIYTYKGRVSTELDEETVGQLDHADITNVDVVIRPREWEPGRIKAYVKEMHVMLEESAFAHKYANRDDEDEERIPF